MSLLDVQNLDVALDTARGPARAVRDVSFSLDAGETLGIVGESGCGKSMTALALMGLLPENARAGGRVMFDGDDLLSLPERTLCKYRGGRIAMIFQEPMSSLNPVQRVGKQISESLTLHQGLRGRRARDEVVALLDRVGIPEPELRYRNFPHQLSGGQRQRVMIAMALANKPDLLIADEPTTALDVTIQKQILDLLRALVTDAGMAMILISHDLGVIANTVDRVAVMYGGAVVETGPAATFFGDIAHPYTRGLFGAVPRVERRRAGLRRLVTIPGTVPELSDIPPGCPFSDRCAWVVEACRDAPPPLETLKDAHQVACIRHEAVLTGESGP